MKLKCTIGSQGFVGGPTYRQGDVYELEDEKLAKQIIGWGDAEEVKEVTSSAPSPPVLERDEVPSEDKPSKKIKSKRKY